MPCPSERAVPPLSLLCLRLLSQAPHQISNHIRLFPSYSFLPDDATHIAHLQPRLWASIIQLYDHLPPNFITYPIHLCHVDMPLLQQIPPTPYFSLVTLLDLPGCPDITDDVISRFSHLNSLAALDISGTKISYLAVKRLAQSLRPSRGPWPLRILRLYDCRNIDNLIFPLISKFPLLCVLDLRGTQCIPRGGSPPQEWITSANERLFFPADLSTAVDSLSQSLQCMLWSSQFSYRLLINSFDQPMRERHQDPIEIEEHATGVAPESFYAKARKSDDHDSGRRHQLKTNLPKGVSALHPSQLMLYRDPPPWNVLGEAMLNPVSNLDRKRWERAEEVVESKKGVLQQAALVKLREMAMHRKKIADSSTVPAVDQSCPLRRRESKNPFVKRRRE